MQGKARQGKARQGMWRAVEGGGGIRRRRPQRIEVEAEWNLRPGQCVDPFSFQMGLIDATPAWADETP